MAQLGLDVLPGIIDTGDPFAGFLRGLSAAAERTITTAPSYFRDTYQGFTAQDQYAPRKDLNFTATLTFSRRTPRTEKYNRQIAVADLHPEIAFFLIENPVKIQIAPVSRPIRIADETLGVDDRSPFLSREIKKHEA